MLPQRPYKTILVASENGTTTLTLNRPERRNAIGPQMMSELLYALEDCANDVDTRVIVLTGAGKTFCSGGDFAQMQSGVTDESLPLRGDYPTLLMALISSPKPVISRVNGHAMGGGFGLVAASTFAIASDEADLGTPEVNVGLFPMMIMAVLARLVPRRKLLELMLFGEKLKASEAVNFGVINRAVPAAELDATVNSFADRLKEKSPMTLKLGLEAFAAQGDLSLEEALPLLQERLGACLATNDAREGLMAFMEKRKPVWTGT